MSISPVASRVVDQVGTWCRGIKNAASELIDKITESCSSIIAGTGAIFKGIADAASNLGDKWVSGCKIIVQEHKDFDKQFSDIKKYNQQHQEWLANDTVCNDERVNNFLKELNDRTAEKKKNR